MSLWRLGLSNLIFVILITVNTRIVTAHYGKNVITVGLSQLVVSIGYFVLVKNIQHAKGFAAMATYAITGSIGGMLGVLVTLAVK